MKSIVCSLVLIFGASVFADGGEGHGGNHVKNNILWAQKISGNILQSETCFKMLEESNCQKMAQKMAIEIQWHESVHPSVAGQPTKIVPLIAKLNGKDIIVTFRTTPELISPIVADVNRAASLTVTDIILLLWHEVGHHLKISDDLTLDRLVLKELSENIFLRTTLVLAQSLPIPELEDHIVIAPVPLRQPVAEVLTLAMNEGRKSSGYDVEKTILINAIQRVISAEKKNNYLEATLGSGLTDIGIYEDTENQIILLRRNILSAINDAKFIDKPHSVVDLKAYSKTILAQGLANGLRSPMPAFEILVESRALQRALQLLDTQPEANIEFRQSIRQVLTSEDELFNPDESLRLEYLRDSIRRLAM